MILIADSGSTKCDWGLVDKSGERVNEFKTMGFNPYFHSSQLIEQTLRQHQDLAPLAGEITHVFFYGAGCSSPSLNQIVDVALNRVFQNAEVLVDHDLLGAAYSTWDGNPSISCIVGTGSNSCYFDGITLQEEVPALAYILGDEGSGSYFGKKLLSQYLYKRLPEHLAEDFWETYRLTKDDIVDNVYNRPHANVYLASFMRFISNRRDDPYFRKLVISGLREFLDLHVTCFPNYKSTRVHFVGSIAFYFRDLLEIAAEELEIQIGNVIKKPIDGLIAYHVEQMSEVFQPNNV
ncbi:MAG: ATPase [Salibacteraceae bacterium]